jgi:hypothetical protein
MAKKMYYTEEEAAEKLGVSLVVLAGLVRDQKLRVFKDGARNMHRCDEVDALAESGAVAGGDQEEIELTPSDSSGGSSVISLADTTETPTGAGKDDTVITAEGISIFDEGEAGVETADPMAKTQITMSMEDQAAIEGAGTGSGLLDLTRESDDTSLGEVLDRIDMEGPAPAEEPVSGEPVLAGVGVASAAAVAAAEMDPIAGFFNGLVVGCAAVALVLGAVALAAMLEVVPGYLDVLAQYKIVALGGCAVIAVLAGGLGFFLTQAAAVKRGPGR